MRPKSKKLQKNISKIRKIENKKETKDKKYIEI